MGRFSDLGQSTANLSAICPLTLHTHGQGDFLRRSRREFVYILPLGPPSNSPTVASKLHEVLKTAAVHVAVFLSNAIPSHRTDCPREPLSCRRSWFRSARRVDELFHTHLPVLENTPSVLSQDMVHAIHEARGPKRYIRVARMQPKGSIHRY